MPAALLPDAGRDAPAWGRFADGGRDGMREPPTLPAWLLAVLKPSFDVAAA
jgi:hypothetical protein